MRKKPLDLSEQSFVGATLIVGSGVGSIFGVSALFWQSPQILVGIGAGVAWALCIALLVMNGSLRRRVANLESELVSERVRVDTFARTADNVSQSVLTALRMAPELPPPPRRRRTSQTAPQQLNQDDT